VHDDGGDNAAATGIHLSLDQANADKKAPDVSAEDGID